MHLARHARQTRDHITKLASKGYQSRLDATPELVVMFVPSEGIYHAALSEDPSLIEYGVEEQVLLATPTTLIGLLRAIHYGWKQEQIAASAREIAESARELHKRIARFVEPFARVGRQLGSAVSAYNEAVGSFEARVMPQLRRIERPAPAPGAMSSSPASRSPRARSRSPRRRGERPAGADPRRHRRHRRRGRPRRTRRRLSRAPSSRRPAARSGERLEGPTVRGVPWAAPLRCSDRRRAGWRSWATATRGGLARIVA